MIRNSFSHLAASGASSNVDPPTSPLELASASGVSEEKEKNGSTKQLRTETKIKSQWKYKITQNEEVQN